VDFQGKMEDKGRGNDWKGTSEEELRKKWKNESHSIFLLILQRSAAAFYFSTLLVFRR